MADVSETVHTQCGAGVVNLMVTDSIGLQNHVVISLEGKNTWSKTFGPWQANSVEETSDGGFIIGGLMSQTNYPYISEIRITRLSSTGQIQWDRQVLWPGIQSLDVIHQTTDGIYIMLGCNLVIKLDSKNRDIAHPVKQEREVIW